ncbi:hypothetical protein AFK68_22550 [Hydrocoleum sp. CS-953]|nr:hypothetical protein AFK68_22550 [Hydrocoleum sp. CS-953]
MQYKTFTKFATKAAQFTATLTSAALLASTAFVSEASALTLRKTDDGRVIGIDGLEVEGVLYDVQLVQGTFSEVFGGSLDFEGYDEAQKAWKSLSEALGDDQYTVNSTGQYGDMKMDVFWLPYELQGNRAYSILDAKWNDLSSETPTIMSHDRDNYVFDLYQNAGVWAKFQEVEREEPEATPEPSLILGLITLGGLLLGSKIKTKD